MRKMEEESKGSTSDDEPEYGSETNSVKASKSGAKQSMNKVGQYLSTNLITQPNITLADVSINDYIAEMIEEMEK